MRRQLRRLRDARRPHLHARRVRLRRRHRRPVEPGHAARVRSRRTGSRSWRCSTSASATWIDEAKFLEAALAAVQGRPDQGPAADRPGRQRPAREAGRVRPDRRAPCARTGKPVEYLVFPDEGHGFARPENRLKFYAAAERSSPSTWAAAPSRRNREREFRRCRSRVNSERGGRPERPPLFFASWHKLELEVS